MDGMQFIGPKPKPRFVTKADVEHRDRQARAERRAQQRDLLVSTANGDQPSLCLGCLDRPEPLPGLLCPTCAGRAEYRGDPPEFRAQSTAPIGHRYIGGELCPIERLVAPGSRILSVR